MDHVKVLKRAWHILWNHRALWIFGIILALATANGSNWSGNNSSGGSAPNNEHVISIPAPDGSIIEIPGFEIEEGETDGDIFFNYDYENDERKVEPGDAIVNYERPLNFSIAVVEDDGSIRQVEIPDRAVRITIAVIVGIVLAITVIVTVTTVARFVSETALIRMVDHYEETGEKLGVRKGFRLGWSRSAWRLFLIQLLIFVPTVVVFLTILLLLGGLVFGSIMAIERGSEIIGIIGIIAAAGMFVSFISLFILVAAALRLLRRFFWRACALEGIGVIEAIRAG